MVRRSYSTIKSKRNGRREKTIYNNNSLQIENIAQFVVYIEISGNLEGVKTRE